MASAWLTSPTTIEPSRLRPGSAHWDLALTVEEDTEDEEERDISDKSNNPYLAGGKKSWQTLEFPNNIQKGQKVMYMGPIVFLSSNVCRTVVAISQINTQLTRTLRSGPVSLSFCCDRNILDRVCWLSQQCPVLDIFWSQKTLQRIRQDFLRQCTFAQTSNTWDRHGTNFEGWPANFNHPAINRWTYLYIHICVYKYIINPRAPLQHNLIISDYVLVHIWNC